MLKSKQQPGLNTLESRMLAHGDGKSLTGDKTKHTFKQECLLGHNEETDKTLREAIHGDI